MIIDMCFKFDQLFSMVSSIARSFKEKVTLVLKEHHLHGQANGWGHSVS